MTAVDRLMSLYKALEKKGIRFYITEHEHTLNDQLRELGAGELVEKGVVRRTIPLALRDAGLDRPYPVEEGEEEQAVSGEVHEDNERLAEIEWAFGADADEWLEKMATEMADEIGSVKKDEKNVIVDAEKHAAWGRIGLFDENELLERLEMHLFDDKNILILILMILRKELMNAVWLSRRSWHRLILTQSRCLKNTERKCLTD